MELDRYLAILTRRVGSARGVWRVTERLRRHYSDHYRDRPNRFTVWDGFDGDLKLKLDRAGLMGSLLYWTGHHSRRELAFLARRLTPDMVFADLGANQGEFTVFAAKRVARGRVLAFEPVPSLFRLLQENLALNGFANVSAFPVALSDAPGRRAMYFSDDVAESHAWNEGTASFFQGTNRPASVGEVVVRTFDEVYAESGMSRLDLVKIDVEGAELLVLRGALAAISRHRPAILMEMSRQNFKLAGYGYDDVMALLAPLGYGVAILGPAGELLPADVGSLPDFCDVVFRTP